MQQKKRSKAMMGARNPKWSGGSKSTDALNARKAWEQHWKKQIPKGYLVAHKDGNPTNNAISNLRLMTLAEHNRITKKNKTLAEQAKGVRNKPNLPEKQRRFR